MSLKLYVKNAKPYTEVLVQGKGIKDNITIGCKCYGTSELEEVRKEFQTALDTTKIIRWNKQLEKVKEDLSLSDEELDAEIALFTDKIDNESKLIQNRLAAFYISQVTHIKNASLQLDIDGKKTDLFITDSREVKPVESRWGTSEECLVVLLDTYFEYAPFRDSLHTVIPATVFNYNYRDNEVKN